MRTQKVFGAALILALVMSLLPASVTRAAAPSTGSRFELTSRGEINFKAVPLASSETLGNVPNTLKGKFGNTYEFDMPRRAGAMAAQVAPTLSAARVQSYKVTTRVPSNVSGWKGISHLDQRLANNGNQFSLEPPDQALCAGNGFVIEGVNLAMTVYSTQGKRVAGITDLNTFFGYPAAINRTTGLFGPFLADPKCLYDASTARWFMTVLVIDQNSSGFMTGTTHVDIAVSKSQDPTGKWSLYSLDTTDGDGTLPGHSGCPCVGDQPLIGFNQDAFIVTTNEFPLTIAGFNGAQVYAMPKALMEAGKNIFGIHFDNLATVEGPFYSLQPAVPNSVNAVQTDSQYFLSALDFTGTLDNRIVLWALTGTSTLRSTQPQLSLNYTILNSETYGFPPNADQKAGTYPLGQGFGEPENVLNTNDDRMNQVHFAGGNLYGALNSVVSVGGQDRAGIAYFVVSPSLKSNKLSGKIVNQGYVAVTNANVIFPSIAVPTNGGSPVMVFTLAGKNYFPGAAFTILGSRTIYLVAPGMEAADGFSGYPETGSPQMGIERWGDYSAAVTDGTTVWMSTEFIPGGNRTQNANWGTFIIQVR